MNLPETEEW